MKQDDVLALEKITLKDAVTIAEKGTHCGMCRIDFLGTGLCPSGKKYGFVDYWPHGRMELVKHLKEGGVKPTEKSLIMGNIFTLINYLLKGIYRKEHVLYPLFKGLTKEEQDIFREVLHSVLEEFEEW